MKVLGALLLFVLAMKGNAQTPITPNRTNQFGERIGLWTILYDSDWNETNIDSSVEFYRIINYDKGQVQDTLKDYYKNGTKQMEFIPDEKFRNDSVGYYIYYYPNGNKRSEGYQNGSTQHGNWKYYLESGELFYFTQKLNGVDQIWNYYYQSSDEYNIGNLDMSMFYLRKMVAQLDSQFVIKNNLTYLDFLDEIIDATEKYAEQEFIDSLFLKGIIISRTNFYSKEPGIICSKDYVVFIEFLDNFICYLYDKFNLQGIHKYSDVFSTNLAEVLSSVKNQDIKTACNFYMYSTALLASIDYYSILAVDNCKDCLYDKRYSYFFYQIDSLSVDSVIINDLEDIGYIRKVLYRIDPRIPRISTNWSEKYFQLYKRLIEFEENSSYNKELAQDYFAIGNSFFYEKKYTESIIYLNKAKEMFSGLNDSVSYDQCFQNIIKVYEVLNNYSKLEEELLIQLESTKKRHNVMTNAWRLALAYIDVGKLYFELGDLSKAGYYFNAAINTDSTFIYSHKYANECLGNYWLTLGDYGKALIYYEQELILGEEEAIYIDGSSRNIGIKYELQDDTILIYTVSENTPASDSNIQPGDKILNINQIPISGRNFSSATIDEILINQIKEKFVILSIQRSDIIYDSIIVEPRTMPHYKVNGGIRENNLYASQNRLANLHYVKGEYQKSISFLFKNLNLLEDGGVFSRSEYGRTIFNIAENYFKMGKMRSAKKYFDHCLEVFKGQDLTILDSLGKPGGLMIGSDEVYPEDYIDQFMYIAYFYHNGLKKRNQALALYRNILSYAFAEYEKQNILLTSENQSNLYSKYINKHRDNYLTFCLATNRRKRDVSNSLANYLIHTKAILLENETTQKSLAKSHTDTTFLYFYNSLLNIKNTIAFLSQTNSNIDLIDSLKNKARVIELVLNRKLPTLLSPSSDFDWTKLRDELNDDEAVVEIIHYTDFNEKTTNYAAIIITCNSKIPSIIKLPSLSNLGNEDIKTVSYDAIAKENLPKINSTPYYKFWQPIASLIENKKIVYFSPDGIYNKINISTFLTPEDKYLADVKDLRIISSMRDIMDQKKKHNYEVINNAILFGDCQFELSESEHLTSVANYLPSLSLIDHDYFTRRSFSNNIISDLPGTKTEVDSISKIMQQYSWNVKSYTGSLAIEEAIKSVMNPRVLHIATHGYFLSDVEIDTSRMFLGMNSKKVLENPLLRSGLLLAGATNTITGKYNSATGLDNGILTAYEVSNLKLDSTEIVVLSACETGLGEIKNGEGVYGLQRAFRIAGARSIIMSLWKVDDKATQILMTSFYKYWLAGEPKRKAFQRAQMDLRKDMHFTHPYFWGGFIYVGE